jgi:ABC-type multidrug transport system permease subunit
MEKSENFFYPYYVSLSKLNLQTGTVQTEIQFLIEDSWYFSEFSKLSWETPLILSIMSSFMISIFWCVASYFIFSYK